LNNVKFLSRPHYCSVCKAAIDMRKIERFIFDSIKYEFKPELLPPLRNSDPIVIRDYGNDIEPVCGISCYHKLFFVYHMN
jgi:hypothetical protein